MHSYRLAYHTYIHTHKCIHATKDGRQATMQTMRHIVRHTYTHKHIPYIPGGDGIHTGIHTCMHTYNHTYRPTCSQPHTGRHA